MELAQYQQYLETLPFPALLAQAGGEEPLNHKILYLNPAFIQDLGYDLSDIPDKKHWWSNAYPDPVYQKVVTSQWELESELARERGEKNLSMETSITNKAGEEFRYKVLTSVLDPDDDTIYQVFFIKLD
ncbi:PAS domain-containing protein [Bowmanella dokdonensis]|uniref:PAS domain-containing protein n=1 Tax=Bowmanella dokdonensis TaxID=751969 RepID=A0A939DNV1_9ALTE|nr:PAS domain-containing protein [Bowmanella dokdonensis]MBN7826219.1 PAS domain-containing protein [Bowmanella dokdonensis]